MTEVPDTPAANARLVIVGEDASKSHFRRETVEKLDEVGVAAAIKAMAERAAEQTGLTIELDLDSTVPVSSNEILYSAARELISNLTQHAAATHLTVELREDDAETLLIVEDNGTGIDLTRLNARVAEGHIGLASQRARIESAGGSLDILARPGGGTRVEVRLAYSSSAEPFGGADENVLGAE